jgi:hypothetical protein
MVRIPMVLRWTRAAAAVLCFGCLAMNCTKSSGGPVQTAPATLNDMHVAAPVTGWAETPGAYQGFTVATFDSFFYDPTYITYHTLVSGFITIYQNATAAETLTVKAIVMDYGTAANAAAIWDTITEDRALHNHMVQIPGFTSCAIGSQMYHELYVFAHLEKFYIELDVKEANESDSVAMLDACQFMTKYKSVTGAQ